MLVASVLVQGTASVTAPQGWTQIRDTAGGSDLRQVLYSRVAGGSEAASYAFSLSFKSSAAGTIVAYGGVDPINPVEASSGQANGSSTSITAPGVSTSVQGALLVGAFGIVSGSPTTITSPTGMLEQVQVTQSAGKPKLVLESADAILAQTGNTGPRTATVTKPAPSIGQLLLLRPA
ncbi:MAG TPA: hypothetical protein VE669_00575 [Actinomycetota bacterium]|nr:hypothetical protein [Actinomycetota bacterium]